MIKLPKGTRDVLPNDAYKWHFVENKVRAVADLYGFREIRTPTFEATELFARGVGDTTDIVNKEMYTFNDKGNRSMTLKPEGTAGVARAYIENGMASLPTPQKMYYITPVFRYERPQSGRLREHHQFGVELYGSTSPLADFEVISVARTALNCAGVKNLRLKINSIGCTFCRKEYNKALREYFSKHIDSMCEVCRERLDKNPLRILDCKEESCKAITDNAPIVLDYLCDDCKKHHLTLCNLLDNANINYEIDAKIVRGLDYYTRTVFEFVTDTIGAQGTVCGGGRYDGLVESVGGTHTACVGFGMGLERLMMVAEAGGIKLGEDEIALIYIASLGQDAYAINLANNLRENGISVETDVVGRSLKAQFKYADKRGFKYIVVLGDSEVESGEVELKNLKDSSCKKIKIVDLVNELK